MGNIIAGIIVLIGVILWTFVFKKIFNKSILSSIIYSITLNLFGAILISDVTYKYPFKYGGSLIAIICLGIPIVFLIVKRLCKEKK